MLQAIIIDDEANCSETLQLLLKKYCTSVNIIAVINNSQKAEEAIRMLKPEIVFMDIEMPHLNGFEVLELTKDMPFEVVFTTAYDHYALLAIKHNAFDYLLKPIDTDELVTAVNKAEAKKKDGSFNLQKVSELLSELSKDKKANKLAVPALDGIIYLDIATIIRISADSNYSNIFLDSGKKITSSKTLKEYEQILSEMKFFRVHNAHLVNLDFVDKYIRGEGGVLVMRDGVNIDVSRQKKKALLDLLG
jgi:two-component system LytT family response regulator